MRAITRLLTADARTFAQSAADATPKVSAETVLLISRARHALAQGGPITAGQWKQWLGSRKGGFRARTARLQAARVERDPEAEAAVRRYDLRVAERMAHEINSRIDRRAGGERVRGRAEVGSGTIV